MLFTKFKMIDHRSRNQSKKIEKIITSRKTRSSPNRICFKIKQVYTSDVRSGQLWTWSQALNHMKQAKLWRIKIWKYLSSWEINSTMASETKWKLLSLASNAPMKWKWSWIELWNGEWRSFEAENFWERDSSFWFFSREWMRALKESDIWLI